jgi:hypothetical protein
MYSSYETIAAQKAAIIPSSRCINFHLPTCVNLQVPVTSSVREQLAAYMGNDDQCQFVADQNCIHRQDPPFLSLLDVEKGTKEEVA